MDSCFPDKELPKRNMYSTIVFSVSSSSQAVLDHFPQALLKPLVVLVGTFRWAFQVVLALAPRDFRHVALHQQGIDILIRVPSSALMDGFRTFPKCQRRYTIILRDNNVSPLAEIDQRNVNRVRPGPDHPNLAVIR